MQEHYGECKKRKLRVYWKNSQKCIRSKKNVQGLFEENYKKCKNVNFTDLFESSQKKYQK